MKTGNNVSNEPPNTPVNTPSPSMARIAGLRFTYAKPSSRPDNMPEPSLTTLWPWGFMSISVSTVSRYEAATMKNSPSRPHSNTRGANRAGPMIAAAPNTIEYMAIAPARWCRGTIVATIADLDGMSNDSSTPVPAEMAITCHGRITSVAIRTAVKKVTAANISLVKRTRYRRFTLSASTPPHIERNSTGPRLAVATSPSINSESVSVRINHSRP